MSIVFFLSIREFDDVSRVFIRVSLVNNPVHYPNLQKCIDQCRLIMFQSYRPTHTYTQNRPEGTVTYIISAAEKETGKIQVGWTAMQRSAPKAAK